MSSLTSRFLAVALAATSLVSATACRDDKYTFFNHDAGALMMSGSNPPVLKGWEAELREDWENVEGLRSYYTPVLDIGLDPIDPETGNSTLRARMVQTRVHHEVGVGISETKWYQPDPMPTIAVPFNIAAPVKGRQPPASHYSKDAQFLVVDEVLKHNDQQIVRMAVVLDENRVCAAVEYPKGNFITENLTCYPVHPG
jgi:hypothetical protein